MFGAHWEVTYLFHETFRDDIKILYSFVKIDRGMDLGPFVMPFTISLFFLFPIVKWGEGVKTCIFTM